MSNYSVVPNYGGKVANSSSNIKQFTTSILGFAAWVYKTINGIKYITTATNDDVYIQKNLFVEGSITNPSDIRLKENISDLTNDISEGILKISPKKYTFKNSENKKEHYGIIAQELEEIFPILITNTVIEDSNNINEIKSVNYIELIPLIIAKMKIMQTEIDELNTRLENMDSSKV
jgi:hypothetical protein